MQTRLGRSRTKRKGTTAAFSLETHRRPTGELRDEIVAIAQELSPGWFTPNVPADTYRDLGFQDTFVLKRGGKVLSFIVYTCIDGSINITLMGTRPDLMRKGLGSTLLEGFFDHIRGLGFDRIVAYTVPPDKKPVYLNTLRFYQRHGFKLARRFDELWEAGALQMIRNLGETAGAGPRNQ